MRTFTAHVTFPNTGAGESALLLQLGNLGGAEEEVVPVLYVEDAGRALAWYQRLGFQKEWEHQFEPGFPWLVSVARGRIRLYLSEHTGDARPNTLIHLYVNDIDTVSKEFGIPDGNRLRVATRRP